MNAICDICNSNVYEEKYSRPYYAVKTVCCNSSACNVCMYRYMELYCSTVRDYVLNGECIPDSIVGSSDFIFTSHCMFCKHRWTNSDLKKMFNDTHLEKGFYEILKQLYGTIESYYASDTEYEDLVREQLIPLLKDIQFYCSHLKVSRKDLPIFKKVNYLIERDNLVKMWDRCTSAVIESSRELLLQKCSDKGMCRKVESTFDVLDNLSEQMSSLLTDKHTASLRDLNIDVLPDTMNSAPIDWKLVEYLRDPLKLTSIYEPSMTITMQGKFHEMIKDIAYMRTVYIAKLGPELPKYTESTLAELRSKLIKREVHYSHYRKIIKQLILKMHDESAHYGELYKIIDILTIALVDYSRGKQYYEVIDYVICELANAGYKHALEEFFNSSVCNMIQYYISHSAGLDTVQTLCVLDSTGVLHSRTLHSRSDPALVDSLWQYDPYIKKMREHGVKPLLLDKYYRCRDDDKDSIPNCSTGYWYDPSIGDIRDVALLSGSKVIVDF